MNYFELYDLPVSFNPDQQIVKQKFYELSKKYHPDFYINQSQEKQDEVLELSTLNNKAFQVLKDPQRRLHYILELKGELVEGENYTLPQSFLVEMMEVNEALMELEFDSNAVKLAELKGQTEQIENELAAELQALTLAYDADTENQESKLKAIKDIYYRNKYLHRIKESLNRMGS
ncbi:Fe-S protein assembly co-chaperone HscB [Pedobacter boryungensis]|uniref:Fe-S protein assembly co-chaperone HscB n=1 Tax=Pedobacter boryungensis TaxID=869962 RepID=A0ABX2D8P7_9SPHI|nr:Fe-S protein assembly co-chaperone HscB [Pedobacter boryungensis]NQX30345.1 Fe-S protein assembly co-chaperone HscB [Pedobacter boryungensis]